MGSELRRLGEKDGKEWLEVTVFVPSGTGSQVALARAAKEHGVDIRRVVDHRNGYYSGSGPSAPKTGRNTPRKR